MLIKIERICFQKDIVRNQRKLMFPKKFHSELFFSHELKPCSTVQCPCVRALYVGLPDTSGSSFLGCFIVVRCCKTVPRDCHVAAFITLKFWIYCKVLIACVFYQPCTWVRQKPTRTCVYLLGSFHEWHNCAQRLEKAHAGSHSSGTKYRTNVLWDCMEGFITKYTD